MTPTTPTSAGTTTETTTALANQLAFEQRLAIPPSIKLKLVGLAIDAIFHAMHDTVKCAVNVRNYLDEPMTIRWPALVHGKPAPGKAGEFAKNPLGSHEMENVGCENVDGGLYGPYGFLLLSNENDDSPHLGLVAFEVPYGQSFPTFYNCYCNAVWVSRHERVIADYLKNPSNDNISRVMDRYYREYQSRTVRDPSTGRHLSAHIGNSYESVLSISVW